jgi:hypothetical protein
MNSERFKQWIAALRSGQYPQGNGYLLLDGKYCCLGVMCEVADIPRTPPGRGDPVTYFGVQDGRYGSLSATSLPREAQDWLGLDSTDNLNNDLYLDYPLGLHHADGDVSHPTAMWCNDTAYLTFPQIADMFEYFGIKEDQE